MSRPAVSVIVPCYNMEQYLSECLQSVLSQTLKNIEIICIDDGSADSTGAILEEAARKDPRLKVIHQANSGVAAARNRGIRTAVGEYVIFIDPDDFYPDDGVLELLYKKASENEALICGGEFSCYMDETGRTVRCFMDDLSGYMFSREGFISYRDYQFDFGYHRFVYNRDFIVENNIFFPPYARFQDPPFFVKAMIAAGKFYAVPHVVYRYRIGIQANPMSWSSAKLQDMIKGHIDVLQMSSDADLADLHALIIRRFEADNVFEPVLKSLREGDERTKELVCFFNRSIRQDLLTGKMKPRDGSDYLLRELRVLEGREEARQQGRLQGYFQLLCSLLRFWRRKGFRYTMLQIYEILSN